VASRLFSAVPNLGDDLLSRQMICETWCHLNTFTCAADTFAEAEPRGSLVQLVPCPSCTYEFQQLN